MISLRAGERIWTESSYKYTVTEFAHLAAQAGFKLKKVWTDSRWPEFQRRQTPVSVGQRLPLAGQS
jgi:uncharacterized SAM-dependent methyltransferase